MITQELKSAFRWHMRNDRPAFYYAQGYNGRNAWPERAHGVAKEALRRARDDVAAGKSRYPAPLKPYPAVSWQEPVRVGNLPFPQYQKTGLAYVEKPEAAGLRFVGRVMPEPGVRNGIWDTRGGCGWYTDPYGDTFTGGEGLCFGVVYQLPGRNGESRFVGGYQFGGVDGGPLLDLGEIFTEPRGGSYWDGSPQEVDASRETARHADSMAQEAAEQERDYQRAWEAGSRWSIARDTIATARAELVDLLKERRAARDTVGFPSICNAIRSRVSTLRDRIESARNERAKLASGDVDPLYFWPGDERLKAAFNEGAGEAVI